MNESRAPSTMVFVTNRVVSLLARTLNRIVSKSGYFISYRAIFISITHIRYEGERERKGERDNDSSFSLIIVYEFL